jgi:hypothetical protein
MKMGTFVGMALLLLAMDVLLTIFLINIYNNMIYFAVYMLFTVIIAAINSGGKSS